MEALVSLGCIGTTLSLGPKTIYQMVIIESTKYWRWGQLESVAKNHRLPDNRSTAIVYYFCLFDSMSLENYDQNRKKSQKNRNSL